MNVQAGTPMPTAGTPGSATTPGSGIDRNRVQLHTYMYEYFLKSEQYELARLLNDTQPLNVKPLPKQSPGGASRDVNGDTLDGDNQESIASNRPKDLPAPDVLSRSDDAHPFLFSWWCQFWDCFLAARGRGSTTTKQYLNHVQQQARISNERQRAIMNPQMQIHMRNQMMQNGQVMTNDAKKAAAMQAGRPFNAQQARAQQQMLQQQEQMHREGSAVDMYNSVEGQSPPGGDMVPSPKRQRLNDGMPGMANMGQMGPMGPMGRGQPQGMVGQQMRPPSQAEINKRLMAQGIDPSSISEMQMNAIRAQSQHPAFANGMRPQMGNMDDAAARAGMPTMNGQVDDQAGMENAFNGMRAASNGPGGPQNVAGHHALHDYQMQLMLLEQQNKKRLLMARQEQEGVTNGQNIVPGQQGFAPPMSPTASRAGRSPSVNDEHMKRGATPQMGGMQMQQPGRDMMNNFSSPKGGFDPNQMPGNMNPNMYPQMAKMMGHNGQPMPSTSHPAFNGQMAGQMNPQQMEMMRQHAVGRPVNGVWGPGGPSPGMMGGMPQAQQAPNMTPQQRNAAMPPPPAPVQIAEVGSARTTPSSPHAAPPTPSQNNKPVKGKKEPTKKKSVSKKAASATAAATPAPDETGQAQTPGPPMTPNVAAPALVTQSTTGSAGPQQGSQDEPAAPNASNDMATQSFGAIEGGEYDTMNLDFGRVLDGADVLDNFDFDSFLNNDTNADTSFAFDVPMNYDESGAAVAQTPGSAAAGNSALEASAVNDI